MENTQNTNNNIENQPQNNQANPDNTVPSHMYTNQPNMNIPPQNTPSPMVTDMGRPSQGQVPEKKTQETLWIIIISLILLILIIVGIGYWIDHSSTLPTQPAAPTTSNIPVNNPPTMSASSTNPDAVSPDEQAAVQSYLTANITQLSPKAPQSGSSFAVTDVTVDSPGRATVQYNDGVDYYTAAVAYHVDSSGTIVVDAFNILDK